MPERSIRNRPPESRRPSASSWGTLRVGAQVRVLSDETESGGIKGVPAIRTGGQNPGVGGCSQEPLSGASRKTVIAVRSSPDRLSALRSPADLATEPR